MDKEQSENRNSAGLDTVTGRTPKRRQKKSPGLIKDKGMIPRHIKKGS